MLFTLINILQLNFLAINLALQFFLFFANPLFSVTALVPLKCTLPQSLLYHFTRLFNQEIFVEIRTTGWESLRCDLEESPSAYDAKKCRENLIDFTVSDEPERSKTESALSVNARVMLWLFTLF